MILLLQREREYYDVTAPFHEFNDPVYAAVPVVVWKSEVFFPQVYNIVNIFIKVITWKMINIDIPLCDFFRDEIFLVMCGCQN